MYITQKWYFVTKIVRSYCEKKLFEAEGRFAIFLRSLEQFYSERSEQFLVTELVPEGFSYLIN